MEGAPYKIIVRTLTSHLTNYQSKRTRRAGHSWRSKDELMSDVLQWTPTHGCTSVSRPPKTYMIVLQTLDAL